jgi:hypothetical protein
LFIKTINNLKGVIFLSIKTKSTLGLKLDDRYKAIIEIAVEKMKADGIQSATKTDVIRQALELYAKDRQISNAIIRNKLYGTEQKMIYTMNEQNTENQEKGTLGALLKHSGKWSGDDGEEILKLIEETRSDAEF